MRDNVEADLAIIGGGYSGLAAAHACVERGVKPVVLEANNVGWGASGRNGGVVSAKFRVPYSAIAQRSGVDCARQLYDLSHEALDLVEHLVDEYDIFDGYFERGGHLRCAHNDRAFQALIAEARWRKANFGDSDAAEYSREAVAEETGSQAFAGGVLTRAGATIRPLAYARGLAVALDKRAPDILYEKTSVTAIRLDSGGVTLETAEGVVRARQVIIATNGYSDLSPAMRAVSRSVVPFRSAIIATEKLPEHIGERLLLDCRSYVETRRMMRWFRKADGRFIFGGRGRLVKRIRRPRLIGCVARWSRCSRNLAMSQSIISGRAMWR